MTAFIIESYKSLQEDPNDVIIRLLEKISAQPDKVSSNRTAALPLSRIPAFEAPSAAVRVNVLWFASLIFSLITASVGILVKQWLREYLSGDHIGPKARLRTRHFRSPGLTKWKVFDIAALLPLLLQVSLGLFFIGLCFFTSSVHVSIGHTCIPIVVGWTFFLVISIIAPLLSPRCPYKTPSLRTIINFVRPRLYVLLLRLRRQWRILRYRICRFAELKNLGPVSSLDDPRALGPITFEFIDSLFPDDDLLTTAIWQSFMETEPDGQEVMEFLTRLLSHRLREQVSFKSMPLDLRPLARRTWRIIMCAVIDILHDEVTAGDRTPYWGYWTESALLLLLSVSSMNDWKELGISLAEVTNMCLIHNRPETCRSIASAPCLGKPAADSRANVFLRNIGDALRELGDNGLVYSILEEIVGRTIFGRDYEYEGFKLSEFETSPWVSKITQDNLRGFTHIAMDALENGMAFRSNHGDWRDWMTDAIRFIVVATVATDDHLSDRYPLFPSRTRIAFGFVTLLQDRRSCVEVLGCLVRITPQLLRGYYVMSILQGIFHAAITDILQHFCRYADLLKQDQTLSRTVLLRFVHITLIMIKPPVSLSWREQWIDLFSRLSPLLERGTPSSCDDLCLAETCMALVHSLAPEDEVSYRRWRDTFDEAVSLFPDDFVHALSTVACRETRWYRVRRLKEMRYYVMPS